MRPAICIRCVGLNWNSLKTKPATLLVRFGSNNPAFGAGRGQFLMRALDAKRCGHLRKAQVERRELDLDSAFLLPVGEGLLDAVEAAFIGELVVLVVGGPGPVSDGVDSDALWPVFALARDLCLLHVDSGVGLGRFQPRHAVQARIARHRDANKSVVEDVGAADRLPVGAHRRIGLPAIERQRLVARR